METKEGVFWFLSFFLSFFKDVIQVRYIENWAKIEDKKMCHQLGLDITKNARWLKSQSLTDMGTIMGDDGEMMRWGLEEVTEQMKPPTSPWQHWEF
jgi:hypothetical protein